MKVICNGYKICINANECYHSKPHEIVFADDVGNVHELSCWIPDNDEQHFMCQCSTKSLRKFKLENLNKK